MGLIVYSVLLFSMKTMREYHNLYLKTGVLLLSDVFGKFRDICIV